MVILFGWRSKPKVVGQLQNKCSHCKRKTMHGLVKVTKWFTLYFIPVIPFSNKLYDICGVCGLKNEIKGEAKEKIEQSLKNAA